MTATKCIDFITMNEQENIDFKDARIKQKSENIKPQFYTRPKPNTNWQKNSESNDFVHQTL